MIRGEEDPAVSNAQVLNLGRALSLAQSHQLIGGQSQNTEHQVPHHLGVALDPQVVAAELILQARITALRGSALVVADGFGRGERDLLAAARVVVDQRNVAQASAVVAQLGAAIGGVHQIVEVGHALRADQRQGNGGKAVVHRCGRKQRGDGHATVGRVEVQFIAVPTDLVPLGIALRAAVARCGDVLEHLRQRLLPLAMNGRLLGRRADFAAPGTAAFFRRRHPRLWRAWGHWRTRLRCSLVRLNPSGLHRGGRHHCCDLGLCRAFARFNGGAIATDMPDQLTPKVFLDERLMHTFRKAPFSKRLESAREGRFGGQLFAQGETTDAPQGAVYRQAIHQSHRSGQPQHGLGHEGIRQPTPLMRRTPHATPGRFSEFLDSNPFQDVDDFLKFRRQRTDVVPQFGQQFVLDHVPPLHDQFTSGSIHFAGVMMLASITASCQKWPPAPPAFAFRREKNRHAMEVLQEPLMR